MSVLLHNLELKLALENEVNMQLLSSIKDVAVVIVGKEEVPLLEDLSTVYSTLKLPLDSIREIVICDRDRAKAMKEYSSLVLPDTLQGVATRFVTSLENNYPRHFLTMIISSGDRNYLDGVYAYGMSLSIAQELSASLTRASLISLRFKEPPIPAKPSDFCETRRGLFVKKLARSETKGAFYQALDELKNGCEECTICSSYGPSKVCPFFQLKIAEFYEQGEIVPTNLPMAVQWKKKAARQGFKEAELSLADTYLKNPALMSSQEDVFALLVSHAENGDRRAVRSLIEYASDNGRISLALPWYARLANSGDFEAQNRIIDLYTTGEDGIPVSKEEEDRWIEVALASGNRTFVSDIAQSYIDKEDWASAFKWYNRLRGEDDFDEDKLVELFENYCESEDLTAEQYVDRGNQYYYGIDGDEIPRLAYYCFEKAHYLGDPEGTEGVGRCLFYGRGIEKDKERAVEEYFIPAAEEGEIQSMCRLFEYYSEEVKDEEAADYWKRTAVIALDDEAPEGNPVAMRLKSLGLSNGDLYEEDGGMAFDLMQEAADLGDVLAQYFLGQYYCHGTGVPIDRERAFGIFSEMANRGLAMAERCIGCCYRRGFHVPRNYQQSFEWYMKAAKRRHWQACFYIGYYYERGLFVAQSLKTANEWYLIAAEEGDKDAQRKLGENYYYGRGIEKSLSEAKKWSVKAAEQGDTRAYFRAAYLCSERIDGKTDYDKALKWYTYLSDQGNAAAKNNLGVMYEYGEGVPADREKASALYLEAAQGGDTMAMSNIAIRYLEGTGIEVDYEQAIYWYEKGLENGSLRCGFKLAEEYISGKHFERDIQKGIETYNKVIDLPHSDEESKKYYVKALMALADLYFFGKEDELEENDEKAFPLFRKAAEEGDDLAYFRLGTMYHYGYYVARDINQAIYWYRLAAEKDNEDAIERLEKIDPNWGHEHPVEHPDDKDDLPF